jgi:hypothetical protein
MPGGYVLWCGLEYACRGAVDHAPYPVLLINGPEGLEYSAMGTPAKERIHDKKHALCVNDGPRACTIGRGDDAHLGF